MNNARFTVFPASNGDAILLTIDDFTLLVDSGYAETYTTYIKPAMKDLSSKGQQLSLFVITHIDADHISGAIRFLDENLSEPIVGINHIWHNSYRHLSKFAKTTAIDSFTGRAADSLPVKSILKYDEKQDKNISAAQGSSLAALIQKGNYTWNDQFKGGAVCIENGATVALTPSISLRLLSPDNKKLNSLYSYWKKELFKLGYKVDDPHKPFDDAFEFIIASEKESKRFINKEISGKEIDLTVLAATSSREDDRVANGSSIAFFIEWAEKKVLFLGDAHPSLIEASLKEAFKGQTFPIKFDAIKISHHGSTQNTSVALLTLIDSDKFIISTNGKIFNHPDIETVARIVTRKSSFKRTLYFNYPTETSAALNRAELMTKYNFEVVIGNGTEPIELSLK